MNFYRRTARNYLLNAAICERRKRAKKAQEWRDLAAAELRKIIAPWPFDLRRQEELE